MFELISVKSAAFCWFRMRWQLLAGLAAAGLLASVVLPGQDLQSWLNDCVVFHIDPARPTPEGLHPGFNDRQKADLAAIFGDRLGYETYFGSEPQSAKPGRVYFVHAPGRRESLAWP